MIYYINCYFCPRCGMEWEDVSDAKNNDRCPDCNYEIVPMRSIECMDDIDV